MTNKNRKAMRIVLCDSATVNSYGFRTEVSGIDLGRFSKNPVMLYNHDPERVIGRWENWDIEDGRLTAVPVFDRDDPFAAEIARKVEDGFIRGCSMGLVIKDITKNGGIETATSSVLIEASIVPIPADENAIVVVYDGEDTRKELTINEFNKLFYAMETNEKKQSAQRGTEDTEALQTQLAERDAKIAELNAAIDTLRNELAERDYHEAETFAEKTVQDGKLPTELKADIKAMYLADKERTVKIVGAIKSVEPAPPSPQVTLSSMVSKGGSTSKTWDDLDKIPGALKELKDTNFAEFNRLYKEKFHSDWRNA